MEGSEMIPPVKMLKRDENHKKNIVAGSANFFT
jgi:hypothetical protein